MYTYNRMLYERMCGIDTRTVCNVHMLRNNYANPVYGVATICHQVHCLRWGHPSLFHTATSLLI